MRAASVAVLLSACASLVEAPGATAAEPESSSPHFRQRLLSAWNDLRGDPYPLDSVDRWLEPGQRVSCDRTGLVVYRGNALRYAGAVVVDPAFRDRLARFEELAAATAREIYGREPRLVRHYGAFVCRATRNRKLRVSEHALGNALDLVGFDFGAATKHQPLPAGAPKRLRGPFQVRVAKHFKPATRASEADALHRRFLTRLTEQLRARDDIFRSMFGPGHGGHDDHLHLDAAPFRYVDL